MAAPCQNCLDIFCPSHLLCQLVIFLPSVSLSLSPPAPTGFTGTQTPTGAVGASEEDGAATS